MKKIFLPLIVLITAFIMASPAIAAIEGGEYTISPFVGGYTFDGIQHLKTNIATGLKVGYNLNKNWGVEGQFTYVPLTPTLAAETRRGDQYSLRADVLYHFMPKSSLVPFVALGGGWSQTENLFGPTNNDATLDYGVGVKYFLNDWLALRGDVREIFSFHTSNQGATDYWQNVEYTVGLTFQFGRPRVAARAVEVEKPMQEIKAPAPPPAPVPAPEPVKEAPAPAPAPVKEAPTSWQGAPTAVPAGKIMVTGMKIEQNALEIEATERIRDYKIFTLSQPSRLVIDISNAVDSLGANRIPVHKLGISTVRFGSYPDHLRVVLDAAQGELLPYRIEETDRGLKIIMTTPEQ